MSEGHDYMLGPPEGECDQIMMMSCMGPHVYCCAPASHTVIGWRCDLHAPKWDVTKSVAKAWDNLVKPEQRTGDETV